MLPFNAVLFDMDGTLVDTEPLWQQAETELMAEYGVEWTEADQAHALGGSTERVARYMIGLIEQAGSRPPTAEQLAQQFLDVMLTQLLTEPPEPQPGVAHLLRSVRESGLPTALVSSSSRPLVNAVLAAIGSEWFDRTISADDVLQHKPDPLPYLQAAGELGIDPAWSFVIEDSPTGAAAATAAGAFVLAVEHLAAIEPLPRRVVIDTLAGLDVSTMAELFIPPDAFEGALPGSGGAQ